MRPHMPLSDSSSKEGPSTENLIQISPSCNTVLIKTEVIEILELID